jgi:hypothetical protein
MLTLKWSEIRPGDELVTPEGVAYFTVERIAQARAKGYRILIGVYHVPGLSRQDQRSRFHSDIVTVRRG